MDVVKTEPIMIDATPMAIAEVPAMRQAEHVVIPAGALAMNMSAQPVDPPQAETLSDIWSNQLSGPHDADADQQPAVTMIEGKNQPKRWGRTGSLRTLGNLAFGPRVAW